MYNKDLMTDYKSTEEGKSYLICLKHLTRMSENKGIISTHGDLIEVCLLRMLFLLSTSFSLVKELQGIVV